MRTSFNILYEENTNFHVQVVPVSPLYFCVATCSAYPKVAHSLTAHVLIGTSWNDLLLHGNMLPFKSLPGCFSNSFQKVAISPPLFTVEGPIVV